MSDRAGPLHQRPPRQPPEPLLHLRQHGSFSLQRLRDAIQRRRHRLVKWIRLRALSLAPDGGLQVVEPGRRPSSLSCVRVDDGGRRLSTAALL